MRKLGIPGEEEFLGRGVSYCATCDGPLYREKEVAVVGGGSAALEEALFLTKFVSRLYLVHRRDKFRGEKIIVEELKKTGKVEFVLISLPRTIEGSDFVESVTVSDKLDGRERTLKVDGVFIFVGVEPNTDFLEGVVELDRAGFVKTNPAMLTSVPGVFAAGDLREGNVRQIAVACGEGTVAALSVRNLLSDYDTAEIGRRQEISELRGRIDDLKSRLPAHSVPAAQLEELEELEERLEKLDSKN
jgi:thioredoxin reductase (NADPH)